MPVNALGRCQDGAYLDPDAVKRCEGAEGRAGAGKQTQEVLFQADGRGAIKSGRILRSAGY